MTRTIWLASYPKSGNTWMRMLIANLATADGMPIDINKVPPGSGSGRARFDFVLLMDSGLLTHDEIDDLRPRAYAAMTRYAAEDEHGPPVRFVKVHDAYTLNSAGEPLLGGSQAAHGAIVIVRDPRDVALSFADYSNANVAETISFMNDRDATLVKKNDRQDVHLRQKLCDWSSHVASWLDQTDFPVHLVRYEDLRTNTAAAFRPALEFAGVPTTEEEINRAVEFSEFARLQKQEENKGFVEAPVREGAKFFRRGTAGSWRHDLAREQVARLELQHWRMMQRLGYELTCISNLARAG